MRVYAYIDGFNLYNRILRTGYPQYKWLDPSLLAHRLSPTRTVVHTRYFTARVKGFGGRDQTVLNQQLYLRALGQVQDLTIHFGQFTRHEKWMKRVDDAHAEQFVSVWRMEEKGSDVNLAAYLVRDAFLDHFDLALVITNDSDFAEAIAIVRNDAHKSVVVYSPQSDRMSRELRRVSNDVLPIRPHHLRQSPLPRKIPGKAQALRMPDDWSRYRQGCAAWIRCCRLIRDALP